MKVSTEKVKKTTKSGTMKRATENVCKMTNRDLIYDGKDHVSKLSDYADSVKEYVDRLNNSDIFKKSPSFNKHLTDNPSDIKVISFSDMKNYLICYALFYKSSLSPFFVSGKLD